jgi:ankyrin repeat protein
VPRTLFSLVVPRPLGIFTTLLRALCFLALVTIAQAQTELPVPTPSFDLGNSLRAACWKGDLAEATRLIKAGAPIEGRDSLLRSPLFLACHGSPDIVKLLLDHGARVDVVAANGDTTIGRACEYGDLESAKLVLAAGADMNRENKYGRTPLMLAAREGRDDLVALLIANHADVNHEGISAPAIYYATWKDHLSIVKMLLDAGARVKRAPELAAKNPEQEPILGQAAYVNDLPLIDLLLGHGADINEASDTGRSVLMYAVQSTKPATISHLLENGANPNAQNNNGESPLMLAINYQPLTVLGDLLDHGAQIEMRDKRGRTALMWAARFALADQTRFLAEHGADINAADNVGETALTRAGDCGAMDIVDYLKDKGAKRTDVHIIQRDPGNPPLTPAQSWALAVGATYTQRNGEDPHVLGYGDANDTDPVEPEDVKRELKDKWNITNKNQLLNELEILRTLGDRTKIQELGAKLANITDTDFDTMLHQENSDPKRTEILRIARINYITWKDKSGLAFDLCRRAHMICAGYSAGYISADEAWPLLLENARLVQAGFHSWQEMGDNFLSGREAASGDRDARLGACTMLLQNPKDPNSPWNQLPWNTPLAADSLAPAAPATAPTNSAPVTNSAP